MVKGDNYRKKERSKNNDPGTTICSQTIGRGSFIHSDPINLKSVLPLRVFH